MIILFIRVILMYLIAVSYTHLIGVVSVNESRLTE